MSHSMAMSILCGGIVDTTLTSSSPLLLVASAQAPCCSVNIYLRFEDELGLSGDELELMSPTGLKNLARMASLAEMLNLYVVSQMMQLYYHSFAVLFYRNQDCIFHGMLAYSNFFIAYPQGILDIRVGYTENKYVVVYCRHMPYYNTQHSVYF